MEYFAGAQICLNGHILTADFNTTSFKFCPDCGKESLQSCRHCKSLFRGNFIGDGYVVAMSKKPPSFCYGCGAPYPWTEAAIQSAKDLADELEDVDAATIEKAKDSFVDLVADTPRTAVAAVRVGKLIKAAGPTIGGMIKDIVVSIGTDAVKKAMGL